MGDKESKEQQRSGMVGSVIQTHNIQDYQVTASKIGSKAVTESKIGGTVVTSGKIGARAIGSSKIYSGSVTLYRGTQISSKILQGGRVGSVTLTGLYVPFSPAFAGVPVVVCSGSVTNPVIHKILAGSFYLKRLTAGTTAAQWVAFYR